MPALSLTQTVAQIQSGESTCEALLEALLDRINEREPAVGAWAYIDPAYALEQARMLDRVPVSSRGRLRRLLGMPIAVKDVIDTADMPTEYGSPMYAGHRPQQDAACISRLRAAGALILGKTVTAEFAFAHPGKTRHPCSPEHTPGGSSSGSAAAVADGMAPAALATQTGGSTIRPAAFCGIVGYKPAYGVIDTAGLKPLAPSMDTIGLMARTLADIRALSNVLTGVEIKTSADHATRLVLYRTPFWQEAETSAQTLLENTAGKLIDAGTAVREIDLPTPFEQLNEIHRVLMSAEVAQSMAKEWRDDPQQLSDVLRAFIERGQRETAADVSAGWAVVNQCRQLLREIFAGDEIILTLSTAGEAPRDLSSTGDARFNRLWTLLGVPCLHLPVGFGPQELPLGIQLVSPHSDAGLLFSAADRIAGQLQLAV